MAENVKIILPGNRRSAKVRILARAGGLRKSDPKLYETIKLITEDLDAVTQQLNPIQAVVTQVTGFLGLPPAVEVFNYTINLTSVLFSWEEPEPTPQQRGGSGNIFSYEIRLTAEEIPRAADWEAGTFVLRTVSLEAAINPLTVGTHIYMIKTLNAAGDYCVVLKNLTVIIPAMGVPIVTATVIDNNVLLSWTIPDPIAFNIEYYEIFKRIAPGYDIPVSQGRISGTWFNLFEGSSGTYLYGVTAVDLAGNVSAEGQVQAIVDQPPDFIIYNSFTPDISAGTHSNTYYEEVNGKVYGPADLIETFEDHFTNQLWADPQDQIDAGHSLFIQENPAQGIWISDEMDVGLIVKNTIITTNVVMGTVDTTIDPTWIIEMKAGDTPGSGSWISGHTQSSASMRYLSIRITIDATGSDPRDSMGLFSDILVYISAKNITDGNTIDCLASDSAGTQVDLPGTFANGHGEKSFSDINSITLTPIEDNNQSVHAIYDFVDIPNPTNFKILCYDSAGRRVNATVAWKVRGVKA